MALLGIWNKKSGKWVMLVNGEIIHSAYPEVIIAHLHNIRRNSPTSTDDVGILSITGWANEADRQEFYEQAQNEIEIVATYERWKQDHGLGTSYEKFRAELGLT